MRKLLLLAVAVQLRSTRGKPLHLPIPASFRQQNTLNTTLQAVRSGQLPSFGVCRAPEPPPLVGALGPLKRLAYIVLHRAVARGEVVYPRVAVFMIGLPGSGKSRVIKARYQSRASQLKTTEVLDLDAEIAQHPEWDENDPDRLYLDHSLNAYSWADARVEARFMTALHDKSVLRLVLDGTGTNLERRARRMRAARDAGMFVKAIYVRVPCQTAIARAAMRSRPVTPERIRHYFSRMPEALHVARQNAHEVEIVDVTFDDAPLPGQMAGIESAPIVSMST